MGASGWQYFVPYEPDIGRALARLREDVFRRGDYYTRGGVKRAASIEAALRRAGEDGTHSVLDVHRVVSTPLPVPTLAWHAEILAATGAPPGAEEMRRRLLDETKLYGSVAPLSEARLVAALGTARPDHATVEAGAFQLSRLLVRGCGVYIVVYDASGAPAEIFFTGMTGD
jgi:hypothetical protein